MYFSNKANVVHYYHLCCTVKVALDIAHADIRNDNGMINAPSRLQLSFTSEMLTINIFVVS